MKPTPTAHGISRLEMPHRCSGNAGSGWCRWLSGVLAAGLWLTATVKASEYEIDGGQLEAYYHRNGKAPEVLAAATALTGDDPAKAAKASGFLIPTLSSRGHSLSL